MPDTGQAKRFCSRSCGSRSYRARNREHRDQQTRQWHLDHPERTSAIRRRYEDAHRDEINAKTRARNDGPKQWQRRQELHGRDVLLAKIRVDSLRRRYGITPEEYDALLAEQGGGCAICDRTPEENGRRLAIDHDHACCPDRRRTCGQCIRGLLCTPCNNRLGVIEDVEWVAAATVYLNMAKDGTHGR